jgi:protein ImuB
VFASIHIPDFSVEALARLDDTLRHRAVAVLEGTPPLMRVASLNEAARQLGMEIGMTKIQAEAFAVEGLPAAKDLEPNTLNQHPRVQGDPRFKLVRDPAHMHNAQEKPITKRPKPRPDRTHGAILRRRSPEQETSAHASLRDVAHGFSPRVEDTAPDTVILDLDGLDRLFGTPTKIARELAKRVAELGMEAHIAVASTPDAARIASHGFSGTTVIASGKECDRLAPLPIEALIAAEMVYAEQATNKDEARAAVERLREIHDTLERWGIRNLRALASLPEISLSERLGEVGLRLQRLARGAHTRTLTLTEPELTFEEAIELEDVVDLLEPLAFLFARMLEQICTRLSSRALAAQELRLTLQLEPRVADEATTASGELGTIAPTHTHKIALPVAMNDARVFLKLLQLHLQQNPPGAPIKKIWLAAEPSRPRVAQSGLFIPLAPEPEKLELTLARIQNVVGEGRTGIAEIVNNHRPDAFRTSRFIAKEDSRGDGRPRPSTGAQHRSDSVREEDTTTTMALRRFRPPLKALVEVREGRPARLFCAREGESTLGREVLWAAGPWCTSGEWWNNSWDCEQWDVAVVADSGRSTALYRIYLDRTTNEWNVEGTYD